jgi:cyclase
LLLSGAGLVKTIQFKRPKYVGDPINAVRIFNDKEVDEIVFLDIMASRSNSEPAFNLLAEIASEAFMPFGYGGGIKSVKDIERLIKIGIEKVILNTIAYKNPRLVADASSIFGSQSIVISIDVKRNFWGKYEVWTDCGNFNTKLSPVGYALKMRDLGAGEIFLNSIDRDGTMKGYDLQLIKSITDHLSIPLVACGGAASLNDFHLAVNKSGASAVAAGSMFVFHGIHRAVLITYPEYNELLDLFR